MQGESEFLRDILSEIRCTLDKYEKMLNAQPKDTIDIVSGIKAAMIELEIAGKNNNQQGTPYCEWAYYIDCYESAVSVYVIMLAVVEKKGIDVLNVLNVLTSMANGHPLTPIDLDSPYWDMLPIPVLSPNSTKIYQSSRYKHLYKYEMGDGSVQFSDMDSYECIDDQHPNEYFSPGLIQPIMDELYPIAFPYMPLTKKREVHCLRSSFAFQILYIIEPDGTKTKVNKCYMQLPSGKLQKISKCKFMSEQIKDEE